MNHKENLHKFLSILLFKLLLILTFQLCFFFFVQTETRTQMVCKIIALNLNETHGKKIPRPWFHETKEKKKRKIWNTNINNQDFGPFEVHSKLQNKHTKDQPAYTKWPNDCSTAIFEWTIKYAKNICDKWFSLSNTANQHIACIAFCVLHTMWVCIERLSNWAWTKAWAVNKSSNCENKLIFNVFAYFCVSWCRGFMCECKLFQWIALQATHFCANKIKMISNA